MKPSIVLSIAACLLMLTPAVAAGPEPSLAPASPCPGNIVTMGVLPYAGCMATFLVDTAIAAVIVVCEVAVGQGNCS